MGKRGEKGWGWGRVGKVGWPGPYLLCIQNAKVSETLRGKRRGWDGGDP